MTATAAMIAEVRLMVAEPTQAPYTDSAIQTKIEKYPLIDARGEEPFTYDFTTQPPSEDANENWIVTYDLNAAAADIWTEKAGAVAEDFDFQADGGRYNRSQVSDRYMKQARHYRSRRSPKTITQVGWPKDSGEDVVFNVNDPIND